MEKRSSTIYNESDENALKQISAEMSVVGLSIQDVIARRLSSWIDYLAVEEGASESTQNTYAIEVQRFLDWLKVNPQAIERGTFVAYRDDLKGKYSPATVNLSLVAMRRYLDWLETEGKVFHNPAAGVKGIKDPDWSRAHKRDELSPDEVRRVFAAIDKSTLQGKRDLAIVSAMAFGALRQIEIQRAQIRDLQTRKKRRILWIWSKENTDPDDFVVVNPELETALAAWIADHPRRDEPEAALFCSLHPRSYGNGLTTRHIRRIVKGYYRDAGIKNGNKTALSLRNSAIAAVIRAGGTLLQVQRVARYIDPKITEKYKYDYDRLEEPAEDMIKY